MALGRFGGDPRADDPPADDEFPLEWDVTKPGNAHLVQFGMNVSGRMTFHPQDFRDAGVSSTRIL